MLALLAVGFAGLVYVVSQQAADGKSTTASVGSVPDQAADGNPDRRRRAGEKTAVGRPPVTLAILGDTPYGSTERKQFPALIADINADPGVSMVLHAGDIKSGELRCSNAIYADRLKLFNLFADPFVLTPGDNDWLDCHTIGGGHFLPTGRLKHLRQVFYSKLGVTLGQRPASVITQGTTPRFAAYRENLRFTRANVVIATVNVVGNGNGRWAWSGLPGGDRPTEREAEYVARGAADRAWIGQAFDSARSTGAAGVVLLMQAEPTNAKPFLLIRRKIVAESKAFDGQVLLIHGDEHIYEVQHSYAGVPNLTRLETFGRTALRWIRLTIDPRTRTVFSWQVR